MTIRTKLLLGVAFLVLPAVLIGTEAVRSNALEQRALDTLGTRLGRSRTYAELETAMFDQSAVVWRYLSGLDPSARKELALRRQVVAFRLQHWREELGPEEAPLADAVVNFQLAFEAVTDSVIHLADDGRRVEAYRFAQTELMGRLEPGLTELNREIYRRTRESSVQGAFRRVTDIIVRERRFLLVTLLGSTAIALVAAWYMARSLTRPISELREAMAVVGAGDLDHPIATGSPDEVGDLARAFADMTGHLRASRTELERLNQTLTAKVDELQRTQAQLVQSEKLASIGEVAAGVAHGLRNPLASLRASAQFVQRHPTSPVAGEQLQALVEEVDRLDRRITHLLDFSRPTTAHPAPMPLSALLDNVRPGFAERLRVQNVALVEDIPGDLPPVLADGPKLEQALLELMANALDAMPEGGTLRLQARRGAGPKSRAGVLIEVTDTGRGIPAEALASVGQPFFTTRPEGTGLGLATARRCVEQHGGTLDLASRPGHGTTVRIWVPSA